MNWRNEMNFAGVNASYCCQWVELLILIKRGFVRLYDRFDV